MKSIENVLLSFKKKDEKSKITHTIIPNKDNTIFKWGASFSIPSNELHTVYKELHNHLFNDKQNLSLTETFQELCPLIFDLDMKYENVNKRRYYTTIEINKLIKLLWITIQEYFILDSSIDNIDECWITEKKEPYYELVEDNNDLYNVKDGLHIIFPNIIGHRKVFQEFMKLFTKHDMIDKLHNVFDTVPTNDLSTVIDTNVQRWFVYGDGKTGREPYLLTNIIRCNKGIETMININELNYDNLWIMNKLCLLQDFTSTIREYKNSIDNILNQKLTFSISTSSLLNMSELNNDDDYNPYSDDEEGTSEIVKSLINKSEIEQIKSYLNMLNKDKVENYDPWRNICCVLKNHGGELLFDTFDEWSQTSSKYVSREDCRNQWDKLNKRGLTIGTLKFMAKMDNPNKYKEILYSDKYLIKLIENCIYNDGPHDDMANIIYFIYKDDYINVDLKDDWYHYNNHKWEKCPRGYLLSREISTVIKGLFWKFHEKYQTDENNSKKDNDVKSEKSASEGREKVYKIWNTKLKDVNYQKNIMEACRNKFYKPCMMELFDANTQLLGFENCVFDLENNILREGYSDDYITMSTKLAMPIKQNELPMTIDELWEKAQYRCENKVKQSAEKKERDNSNKTWLEYIEDEWDTIESNEEFKIKSSKYFNRILSDIYKFFEQIMPDNEVREYTLRYIAGRLCGDAVDQKFSVWTGSGGNGKSMLIDLIQAIFGDYCKNLPVTLITQKRKASNAASPEKAVTKGVRICHMAEPDTNERINTGEMKELSGGDTIQARKLYGDVFEFKPQFEIILMCNEKPRIEDKSNGAWRRVLVTPFVSRFIDDKSKLDSSRNIYPRNKHLPTRIKKYWPVIFMLMVLKQWVIINKNDTEYRIPTKMNMETEDYKNSNDIIGQWMKEETETSDDVMEFQQLYESSCDWCIETNNDKFDKKDLKNRLLDWQCNNYGFSEGGINGTKSKPKFNLITK